MLVCIRLLLLVLISLLPLGAAAPRIFCSVPVQDLGQIQKGRKVERVFLLENRGEAALHITKVEPGCDCTTVPLPKQVLEPGESLELRATFDSTKQLGTVEKAILIYSNDPVAAVLPLMLKAEVLPLYILQPPEMRFPTLGRHGAFERVITLRRSDGGKVKVKGGRLVNAPAFAIQPEGPKEGSEVRVRLRYLPGGPVGGVDGQLILELEDAMEPRVLMPFQGMVVADLSVHPKSLDLGTLKAGDSVRVPLRINLFAINTELLPVEVYPAFFDVELLPRRTLQVREDEPSNRGFEVRLRLRPDAPAGPIEGHVRISTEDSRIPTVEVPIKGHVSEGK